jgi:hypothetical protein
MNDAKMTVWKEDRPPTLEEAQAHVGGMVELVYDPHGKQILVNEEGLLMGLPHNREASILSGRFIVGPALWLPEEEQQWT